ncbi:MAG: TolC family protein [Flavobacteriales bacterium]|nr:TolC family protein [Flavobacteriales bacterium]
MNAWKKRAAETIAMLCMAPPAMAQDTLSLVDAVALALANEHGIRMARNEAAIAERFATAGNAGLLPRIDLSGRGTWSNQYTRLDFIEGIPDVEREGVENTLLSGTLGLTWTLFDGMGSYYALERARIDAELADLRTRAQVEGTVGAVVALYFALAGLSEDVAITQRLLEISQDRYQRLEDRAALGGAGRLEVLNALVDLRADSASFVLSTQRLQRTGHDLNVLLGRSPVSALHVARAVSFADGLDQERLVSEALSRNVELQMALRAERVAQVEARQAKSVLWPRLDLNAGYGITDQQNEVGIILGTYNRGLNAGLTASVPLFDGGRVRTRVESAKLRAENAALAGEQARLQVERDVRNAFTAWAAQRKVYRIQGQAVETARINFERTSELFYAGQLTGLQFRQAQLDLANAERQAVVAGFDTKVAEMLLLQASGGLLDALGAAD